MLFQKDYVVLCRTFARKSSIEGFYVCGGLDIGNLIKTPLIYSVSYFNLEGLVLVWGG